MLKRMNELSAPRDRLVDLILLAGAFFVLFIFGLRSICGADLWLHLAAGRHVFEQGPARVDPFSFGLEAGTAWQQTSWLYDALVYLLWRMGGPPLTTLAHIAVVVGAFLLLVPATRREGATYLHLALALLLSGWILAPMFTLRPMLFALLPAALVVHILSRPRWSAGSIVLLLATQAFWSNIHISFLLGPFLAAMHSIGALLDARKKPRGQDALKNAAGSIMLTLSMVASCLVNPFGTGAITEALDRMFSQDRQVALEWISPFYSEFQPGPLFLFTTTGLVLLACVFIFHRERLPSTLTTCAILSAYSFVRSSHILELGALLAFPFFAMGLGSLGKGISTRISPGAGLLAGNMVRITMTAAILASGFWIISNRYYIQSGSAAKFGMQPNIDVYPALAVDLLDRFAEHDARVLNLAQDGGYLLWMRPGRDVFTDPRGHLYGNTFFRRFARQLSGQPELNGEQPPPLPEVDILLLNATWPGVRGTLLALVRDEQWAIAYFDGTSVLLMRQTSANRPFLENTSIQKLGLEMIQADFEQYREALDNRFVRPPNPARLIGAAAIYQGLGRLDEALAILEVLTAGTPRMASAWVNRGIIEVQLERWEQAIRTLEKASTLLPSHPLPWLWLSRAYERSGRDMDAQQAAARARDINPLLTDRFESKWSGMNPDPGFSSSIFDENR